VTVQEPRATLDDSGQSYAGNHVRTSTEVQCALCECVCKLDQVLRYFSIGALISEP
jgi:hypothetical protein